MFDASQGRLLTVRDWCVRAREAAIAPIGRPSQRKGGFAVLMKTLGPLLLDVFPRAGERKYSLSKKYNQASDDDCRLTTLCGGLAQEALATTSALIIARTCLAILSHRNASLNMRSAA